VTRPDGPAQPHGRREAAQNGPWLDPLPGHRANHTLAAPPEVNVRSATSGEVNPTLGMTQEPSVRLTTLAPRRALAI
jgi:hypothetical protein